MVSLKWLDFEDHFTAGAEASCDGVAALDRRNTWNGVPGGGAPDQRPIPAGALTARRVDDNVDQAILDESDRIPRAFSNLVNVAGGNPCLLQGGRGPASSNDAKSEI